MFKFWLLLVLLLVFLVFLHFVFGDYLLGTNSEYILPLIFFAGLLIIVCHLFISDISEFWKGAFYVLSNNPQ